MRALAFIIIAAVLVPIFGTGARAQVREKRVAPVDGAARQTFEKQIKVALLVGVGNYSQASGLGALKYPSRDVAALAGELEKQGYLVRKLVDSEASRGVVRRSLNELAGALDRDQGTFLFYFSGHGFQQSGRNYLATFGSTAEDLKEEGLAVSDVESILKASGAKQSMMFIDACRNDPAAGARSVGTRTFASLNAAQGLRTLYSTREGRVSYESDDLQQGVFTHFLVQGLRGEAAGGDGLVTFRDLTDYLVEQVRAYGVRSGQVQVPYEAGESSGDFLLAKSSAPMSNTATNPSVPASGLTNSQTSVLHPIVGSNKGGAALAWAPNGRWFVAGSGKSGVDVWGADGQKIATLVPELTRALDTTKDVIEVAVSRDGERVAASYRDATGRSGMISEWTTTTWKEIWRFTKADGTGPSQIAFGPDGRILAGVDERSLDGYDALTGKLLYTTSLQAQPLASVKWPLFPFVHFSPTDPRELFISGNRIMKGNGQTGSGWMQVSPEREAPAPLMFDISPVKSSVIWGAGAGAVQVSTDAGATWTKVMSGEFYIGSMVASTFVAGGAYFRARLLSGRHEIWRTDDYGKNWKKVFSLDETQVGAIRESPSSPGLFAVTSTLGISFLRESR